ncbi:efflux RND transporter periplasmic adaptor subunit [uncultured Draconibacterium sp.]|uniref:efflux RND transporter periplasmic adaptor subunit n=1 Tax=uncultured Draconibacterium sp. TaxID=1573823 RepID=UPI0025DC9A9E|nr:efflux RND transporter periplasmic adaptor subunit [uncultured Draconibacterium sp.]
MKLRNFFIGMIAIAFAFTGCKTTTGDEPQAKTVKYVKVETINGSTTQSKLTLNGKIKEKSLTSLSFRVGGPLLKLNVKQGDYVRAGQVIAQIDKRDYELQVQTTKAQFEQLESEYNRYKQLIEQKKIPENTFEKVKSGYLMAKTAFENAQNQLYDTELKAPFSGYIFEKFTENHQTVAPGQPIVSVIDNSKLEAVVWVSESQLQRVKSDKESLLTVANAGVRNLPVKLLSIGEKAMDDGLYEVKFLFENKEDMKVAPGMTAEVTLMCMALNNQISVPGSALFHEKENDFVWVYNPGSQQVEKREITIAKGGSQGRAFIHSGLKDGEQVVAAGVHYLYEGQKVKLVKKPSVTNVGGLL